MSNGAVFERAYPSDLRDGAGIRFDKFGLMATARLEYRNIAALKTSPQKGLVAIQDPDTGQFGALDFAQLPVAQPADASITNVKLGPAPGLTIKGNAVDAAAQPQDIPLSSLVAPGNPIGDAIGARPTVDQVGDVAFPAKLFSGTALPAQRAAAERATENRISLLNWVTDRAERARILAGTSTSDHTALIRQAILDTAAANLHLLIEGVYNVSDKINGLAVSQSISGRHWFCDGLKVLPTFNPAATCVLEGNHYCTLANFSISYQSPLLTTPPLTRATIGTNTAGFPDDRYRAVPAINVPYIQTRIDGVCIKNAMYGIRARGNCGAAYWTDLRIGAFTKGVETDGALDFITGSGWRFWPYGYDGLAETFYYDGQTVGWDCAQVESVAVTDLNFFGANMVVRAGELNPGTTPFGNVGSVSLDGNCSRIIMQGGRLNIGVLYSTKDSGQAGYGGKSADCFRSLVQTGGRLQIGLLDSVVNGGANDMEINGGTLEVLGGTHQQVSAGFRSLFVTGGYVRAAWTQQPNISAGTLVQQAVARPVEFAAATGTGVLNAQDMTFMPQRTGDSGNAIVFASDLPGSVAPLNAGGWGIAATNGIQNLQLGPTFAAGTTFSPTVNFVTPNGFVPVYVERHGRYWHTACGIEFTMRLVVNMNNVSVASGRLFITGLPALNGEATGRALTLGEWSGIAFDVPFTQLNAAYDDTRKALVLWECGRASGIAPSAGPIIATNFINNAIMVLNLSGSIAKR